jgi:hypothetical protein
LLPPCRCGCCCCCCCCFCYSRLLEGIELYKEDWEKIASYVGKSQSACLTHFVRLPIEDPYVDDLLNWTGTDFHKGYPN